MTTRARSAVELNDGYLYVSVSIVLSHAFLVGYTRYKVSGEVLGLFLPRWRDLFSLFDGVAMWLSLFVGWIVVVGVAHTIATIGNGNGQFRDLLALWGLGAIPQLLAGIVTFFVLDAHVSEAVFQLASESFAPDDVSTPPVLRQLGRWNAATQYFTLAWGAYCVFRIHRVSWVTSAVAVLLPFAIPLLFRLLLQL